MFDRRILFGVVTWVAFLALAIGALEIGLRLAYRRSTDFSMEMWKYAVRLKRPDPARDIGFVHVPGARDVLMGAEIRINNVGLRGDDVGIEKPPHVYRVMLLGDSTTLGWGVPVEQTTARLLEGALNERQPGGRRFEILNAGVGNYNTVQEVATYRRDGRRFRADLVVLVYFINDAEPLTERAGGLVARHSYALAFLGSRVDLLLRVLGARPGWEDYYHSLYRAGQPGWMAAQAAIADLASLARQDRTTVLVALLPELHHIDGAYPFTAEHDKVRRLAEAQGVPVLDLVDGLRGHGPEASLFVTPLDSHPNAKANRLIAAQICAWILR